MKKFSKSLREHALKIINFEKKKMIPSTSEEYESYLNQANCHICKKKSEDKYTADKNYGKLRDLCNFTGKYRGAAHIICNLKYSIPMKILLTFHNGSNYDYHVIVKELAKEFKGEFNCLEKNTEKKYKTFSVLITKEVKMVDKNGEEFTKPYFTHYSLLITAHYQILLKILQRNS